MSHHAISQQVLAEHQTLAFVTSALRSTMGWKFQGSDLSRKLASLLFVAQSFQRHLKRLMSLEEEDGYMDVVSSAHAELHEEVESLRGEHGQFRRELTRLLSQLRRVSSDDHEAFAKVSAEFSTLLERLDLHSQKETDLIQQALLQDEGGEG